MQKEKIRQKQNGITLIALIITIIVMLILVGVSVTVALDGGLFSTAKSAKVQTQEEKEKEQELASGRIQIGEIWYDSMEDYANNNPSSDQTDIKYKKEKEELTTTAQGTKGADGKVDITKLEEKLEGWTIEGEGPYTCTSPNGNTFKIDEDGEIIVTGTPIGSTDELKTKQVKVGDLVYVANADGETATVYGYQADVDNYSAGIILLNAPNIRTNSIKIESKVQIGEIIYTVNAIGNYAFAALTVGVESLESVLIPDTVTSIGNFAFSNCTNLSQVTTLNSVTTIGVGAFRGTEWEKTISENNDGLLILNGMLFSGSSASGNIVIPNTVNKIFTDAFTPTNATSITIPSTVTTVGSGAISVMAPSLTTINVSWEEGNKPEGWADDWNRSSATVVYGYTGQSE